MNQQSVYIKNQPLSTAKEIWTQALTDCGFFSRCQSEVVDVDNSLGRLTANPVFASHSSPSYNRIVFIRNCVTSIDSLEFLTRNYDGACSTGR